jgi:uncharacterized protein YcbX
MACPAENKPIQHRLEDALEEDVQLPASFYVMTVAMIAIVMGAPFLYRRLWLLLTDFLYAIRDARNGPPPLPGFRRIGKLADRNLSKEFEEKIGQENGTAKRGQGATAKVVALFEYPIKSCYGVEIDEAEVRETGFKHDRQFCFGQLTTSLPKQGTGEVSSFWNFVTQRTHPALTLVKTEIWVPDPSLDGYDEKSEWVKSEGFLQLSFPWTPFLSFSLDGLRNLGTIIVAKLAHLSTSAEPRLYLRIPLNPDLERKKTKGYSCEDVTIHSDYYPQALNMTSEIEPDALAKLKYFLGVSNPLSLFRTNAESPRPLYKCAPTEENLGYKANVGMADSYPIHILNIASVMDMESRVPKGGNFTADARRYRANIYFSGLPAYEEDGWTLIRIGGKDFHVACRTTRCKLPNTNPDTAVNDPKASQPFSTMNQFRKIDAGARTKPCLGMMLVPSKGALNRPVKAGDDLKVLKMGEHFYVKSAAKEDQKPPI